MEPTARRQPGVKRLRFSYPEALPPGLLPRLIVRTHELSKAHAEWRWRSGVVLVRVGARALVRLDRNERRTEVAVTWRRMARASSTSSARISPCCTARCR